MAFGKEAPEGPPAGMKGRQVGKIQRAGQSAVENTIASGDIVVLQALYLYPDGYHPGASGGVRAVEKKVLGGAPGVYFYTIYPPVDPDADPTEILEDDLRTSFIVVVT